MLNIKMLKKTKRYLKQNNELYKFKCILKQKHIQLPEFSREIKLSFHLDQFTTPQIQQQPSANTTSNSTLQDAAIFQLPLIKINNSRYSVFFDSGCSNFVSRYNAIRSLTSNATQECPGPITIGGVRVVISVSQHGIYKVNLSPMMEVKLQCREFVLIISHRNVQYTQSVEWHHQSFQRARRRCKNSSKNTKLSRWGKRLHHWDQVFQVLPKDDISITVRTNQL